MRHDNPDTIAIEETEWQHTEVDDVFLPSVRVQLSWRDVESAVERGAVVPKQAHALWAGWASPTSGLRVGAGGVAPKQGPVVPLHRGPDQAMPDVPGPMQRYGLGIGLVLGLVAGAGGAWLALGA